MANIREAEMGRNDSTLALTDGRPQIGLRCSLSSNILAEIVGEASFDWSGKCD